MPTFYVLVQQPEGLYRKHEKQYETTRRDKAADEFYRENPGDEDFPIEVVNAAQSESFKLSRTVEPVTPKVRKPRKKKEEQPNVADNSTVDDDASAASPFGSRSEDPEPAEADDEPAEGVKGFKKSDADPED